MEIRAGAQLLPHKGKEFDVCCRFSIFIGHDLGLKAVSYPKNGVWKGKIVTYSRESWLKPPDLMKIDMWTSHICCVKWQGRHFALCCPSPKSIIPV